MLIFFGKLLVWWYGGIYMKIYGVIRYKLDVRFESLGECRNFIYSWNTLRNVWLNSKTIRLLLRISKLFRYKLINNVIEIYKKRKFCWELTFFFVHLRRFYRTCKTIFQLFRTFRTFGTHISLTHAQHAHRRLRCSVHPTHLLSKKIAKNTWTTKYY